MAYRAHRGVDPAVPITPRQRGRYLNLRREGWNRAHAAREAGFSYSTAKALDYGLKNDSGEDFRKANEQDVLTGPKSRSEMGANALRGLDDFGFFRRHYLGHVSTPWQIETGNQVVDWLATPDKEFVVQNVAPGVGKTTLIHDLSCWVTVRDRRIRGLQGSRIENNARRNLRRIKRSLERTSPPKARSELIERGLAVDAIGCLAEDYGAFKPASSEVWRADEFVVAQNDDALIEEREPTWSCYGMDSGVLSNRFNVIFWDDVVDKATLRTLDAQNDQRQWWDDEAETRLEPGGVLLLVGQRMGAADLYRYCLDKTIEIDEEDEPDESVARRRMYHHVVYRAHDETRCEGKTSHRKDAKPWPEGCLLDPYRLPWSGAGGLRAISATKPRNYAISYQQEDADPENVLVKDVWIWGGNDPDDGTMCPGVMDGDRGLCELPANLVPPLYSIASVDPSPTKMWACQWFIHAPEAANQSFLMDLERKAMPANELLDWNANEGVFYGLMQDWQVRSVRLGWPITTWIIEINAAQRFLLPYDHVRRWMAHWGVSILPHSTSVRKLDQDLGPYILRDRFKFGNIRLPAKHGGEARYRSLKLIDEVLRWPNAGVTDDEVMACWFQFVHLPRLVTPPRREWHLPRPSWSRKGRELVEETQAVG